MSVKYLFRLERSALGLTLAPAPTYASVGRFVQVCRYSAIQHGGSVKGVIYRRSTVEQGGGCGGKGRGGEHGERWGQ